MAASPDVPLASLDLLRQITDRHVIDQLLGERALTRAEIAARTGISKPTISESVRRLEQAGLLAEAGTQDSGRPGRSGLNYALRDDLGVAVAISAGPGGLVAETIDVRGGLVGRAERTTSSTVTAAELDPLLQGLVRELLATAPAQVLAATLSVAGPVDRATGRLIRLPNSPYLVDELNPRALLEPTLGTRLIVDNDVNWAALAEHRLGNALDLDDFCYCYLGHGLGAAVVRGGVPVVGSTGLAGEIAHVLTRGPGGRTRRLVECFGALGLLEGDSPAIDVPRVREVLAGASAADRRLRTGVIDAVAGALASVVALLDPAGVVIGGPWGSADGLVPALADRLAEVAVFSTDVRSAALDGTAPLAGARLSAVRTAQSSLLGPLARELAD